MDVVFYSTGCPKCKILKKKLDDAGITYVMNESVEEMIDIGIYEVPMLRVDDKLLGYADAVNWVKEFGDG